MGVVYLKPSIIMCMERSALKERELSEGFSGQYIEAPVTEVDLCQWSTRGPEKGWGM